VESGVDRGRGMAPEGSSRLRFAKSRTGGGEGWKIVGAVVIAGGGGVVVQVDVAVLVGAEQLESRPRGGLLLIHGVDGRSAGGARRAAVVVIVVVVGGWWW
jgi:hypothetical protein